MKKIITLITALCLTASLAACSEKEQTVTYRLEQEENDLKISDTMVLNAKGDEVQSMTETVAVDMSAYDEDTQALIAQMYDALVASYQEVDGVEASGSIEGGVYTLIISIDSTGGAVSELAELGLLEVEGETEGISLELTSDSLEENGYELVE